MILVAVGIGIGVNFAVDLCAAFPSYVVVGVGTSLAVLVALFASLSLSRKGQLYCSSCYVFCFDIFNLSFVLLLLFFFSIPNLQFVLKCEYVGVLSLFVVLMTGAVNCFLILWLPVM